MTAPPRRGRPRSEEVDAAILAATLEELAERGYLATSVESIAARAGVAKTSIYRRWPTTTDLAVAAMGTFEEEIGEQPEGSVREQLLWLLDSMRRKWNDPTYGAIMRRVSTDASVVPELFRQTRDKLIGPHIRRVNAVIRRGIAEGLIRDDVDLAWIRAMLTAPIMTATLTMKEQVGPTQLAVTVDTVLRGLAP